MKFKTFVILFLISGVLPDVWLLLGSASDFPLWAKTALCVPTLVTFSCIPFIGFGIRYTAAVRVFSWFSFLFELPKLLACFAGRSIWAAGIGAAVSLTFFFLIFFFSRHLVVKTTQICIPSLPKDMDGMKICQISDLHVGSFGKAQRYVRRIVEKVLSLSPELILFTGDLVNFSTSEVEPFRETLSRLKAPMGVFSVRGNHDYLLHGHHSEAERLADVEALLAFEESLGWTVLRNQNVLLRRGEAAFSVAGVDNVSSNPFFKDTGGNLARAVEGIPADVFTILLSHDPSHWRREILPHTSIPLTLSGHTHGLPLKLAGTNPSHWRLRESWGLYEQDGRYLYVSRGLGSAFAFRLGSFPSIDLIILKR